jgi:dihydroorotase
MTNPTLVIRGGLIVGPFESFLGDVLIADGRIVEVGPSITAPSGAVEIDAAGCWVGPGFVDLHTHLREPGKESAETIETGAFAAALGGYSAVVAMPNTEPALDSVAMVGYVLERGKSAAVDVAVAGAITIGRQGEQMAPIAKLAALGVRLFTDDGNGVQDAGLMRRALTYAQPLGVTLAQHCEDESLAQGGSMHEGASSSKLGLTGRPAIAEELMVMRDIELVRVTGCSMHFLHLSTERSIALVIEARTQGLPVTCEVAPHHFTLDETACETFDPEFKVHPPLRTAADVAALRAALRAGAIDAVATDHAPHTPESKDMAFDEAPPGMLGLEQAAGLTLEALGGTEADPQVFFSVLSRGPARVAQLRDQDVRVGHSAHGGAVSVGEDANLVVFDLNASYVVDRDKLASRARNTPYHGRTIHGRARATVVRGRLVQLEGNLQ